VSSGRHPVQPSHLTRGAGYAFLVVGAGALSVWQAGQSRHARTTHWAVALIVVAAVLTAAFIGRNRQRTRSGAWATDVVRGVRSWRQQPRATVISVVAWTTLVAAVVSWDLASFIAQSHTLPTLSYFIGHVTRYRVGRGVCFAVWLGVGAYLVAGWRRRNGRP
jgi:hypothetical protein